MSMIRTKDSAQKLRPLTDRNPFAIPTVPWDYDYSHLLADAIRAQRHAVGISAKQAAALAGMSLDEWLALEDAHWFPGDYRTEKKIAQAIEANWMHVSFFALVSSNHRQKRLTTAD